MSTPDEIITQLRAEKKNLESQLVNTWEEQKADLAMSVADKALIAKLRSDLDEARNTLNYFISGAPAEAKLIADLAREKERAEKAELERDGYKHSANFHRDRGITLLDAKWLDPACHKGCQSLVIKAKQTALEKELADQQSAADEAQLYRAELLRKLEAAEKELADADLLLGAEWRASMAAVNGDPEMAREHRIAALVTRSESAESRLAALQGLGEAVCAAVEDCNSVMTPNFNQAMEKVAAFRAFTAEGQKKS